VWDLRDVPEGYIEGQGVLEPGGEGYLFRKGQLVCFWMTNTPVYGRVEYSAITAPLASESRTAVYVWVLVTWIRLPLKEQIAIT
jgi:hypothetical protein